jgi:hypothetical protein
MNTGGVLLVDDVPGERANFEHAFGPDLTVAPSIDQLNEQLRHGLTWDLAFVDFNLSSQTSTGLTALLRLHHERPATQIVTYSQFTESGRTLYAAAAHHWFRASALMDKTKNDPGTLVHYRESICSGINPTPVPWQRRLQWAPLIDNLLADASWVRIWRALRDAAGDMALVAELLHVDSSSLRSFKDRATQAAIEFNEKFHDIPHPGRTRNKKGILADSAGSRCPRKGEVMLTLGNSEMLDCVAQRGTGHRCSVLIKEASQFVSIDLLARLPQRPAHGLVDQVVAVRQQDLGQAVKVSGFAPAEEALTGDHGNPTVPQPARPSQFVER